MTPLLESGPLALKAGAHGLVVQGVVDFDTAAALARAGSAWMREQPGGSRVVLDLTGIEHISSAALSVLLEWLRQARSVNVVIQNVELSTPLARLTAVAGLDALLPAGD